MKLHPQHMKSSDAKAPEFLFNKILTGSDNSSVYKAVTRSHVSAAIIGFDTAVFAFGQTVSGKTFTH